ncbi:MAG: hypothetical protein V1909_06870 [Candidatus Micrarchaeota archaeon]
MALKTVGTTARLAVSALLLAETVFPAFSKHVLADTIFVHPKTEQTDSGKSPSIVLGKKLQTLLEIASKLGANAKNDSTFKSIADSLGVKEIDGVLNIDCFIDVAPGKAGSVAKSIEGIAKRIVDHDFFVEANVRVESLDSLLKVEGVTRVTPASKVEMLNLLETAGTRYFEAVANTDLAAGRTDSTKGETNMIHQIIPPEKKKGIDEELFSIQRGIQNGSLDSAGAIRHTMRYTDKYGWEIRCVINTDAEAKKSVVDFLKKNTGGRGEIQKWDFDNLIYCWVQPGQLEEIGKQKGVIYVGEDKQGVIIIE